MSKSQIKKVQRFSEMFKALSNPHRLKIFMRLANCCGPGISCELHSEQMKACVGQLGKDLGIVQSTISHHIKELSRGGLIQMERRGKNIDCWIDPDVVQGLAGFFAELSVNSGPKRKK
jgi:ArsR family transcriptional regulator